MIEKLNLTVFLDSEKVKDIDLSLYPEGIPCQTYLPLNDNDSSLSSWVFLVDKEQLNLTQNYQLYNKYKESTLLNTDKGEIKTFLIPFDHVSLLIDWQGTERDLEYIVECQLLTNNAKKVKSADLTVNGETLHILIMGLQQALFLSPADEVNLNQVLLPMAIDMINKITSGNPILKQAYLKGFPCEYIAYARELLFP